MFIIFCIEFVVLFFAAQIPYLLLGDGLSIRLALKGFFISVSITAINFCFLYFCNLL
mgnify:CR=1 FL=1